jgi:rod shape-determining protein MreB
MAVDLDHEHARLRRGRGASALQPSVVAIDQRTVSARRRPRGQAHVGAPRRRSRHPPAQGRRDRRFDVTEQMLRHFIQKVTSTGSHIRGWSSACRRASRVSRNAPSRRRRCRRERGSVPDRRADGGCDRRRPTLRGRPEHDRRHRRRDDRVAVISLGGIVVSQSLRVGGDEMDRRHQSHQRSTNS